MSTENIYRPLTDTLYTGNFSCKENRHGQRLFTDARSSPRLTSFFQTRSMPHPLACLPGAAHSAACGAIRSGGPVSAAPP